ncbi:ABC transporter transmembrane domain-containing protein [Desulfolithobacter dissulfuricans]|nr:ABC transporter ATP-binding protein/permease [Desulfolithobacter dissulfuricans]
MRVTRRPLFSWILHRHRGMQLILLAIILASLFFRVFPLEMQKRIINEAIHLRKQDLLFLYCGLYIGAVTLAGISKYAINVLQTIIGQKILVEMRQELYHHILQLPLQFYRKMQPGTVVSAMTSELNAIGFFLGGALAIPLTSILTFVVFLGYMYSLSPLLALLSMGVYPLEVIVIPLLQKKYNRLNRRRIKTVRSMANVVNEAISGIHEIHANASYNLEERRIGNHIRALYNHLKKLFFVKYGIKFANNLFQSFGPFILFLVGGYLAIHGKFTLGALVAFLSAYEKVYDPWKEMIEYYQSYQDARVRYRQIMQIFDMDPAHSILPEGREPLQLEGNIEIKNAGFSINTDIKLLQRINLDIQAGEQVALVGFSGSGKSTLVLLIAQLYDLTSGSILLDGYDIATLSKQDINHNMTMIAQRPFIFTGTIRQNLLYGVQALHGGDPHIEPERRTILQAVRDVGLEEDIIRFGFQSVLDEEQCEPFRERFLRMRQIISIDLRHEFADTVEFYNARSFLYYSSIHDNIVFGEGADNLFATDNLPDNREFMQLLERTGMLEPLLELGFSIAIHTVELLGDYADDEFFFRSTPMEPTELQAYAELVRKLNGDLPTSATDQRMLLILALRFIPAVHKITSLPQGLDRNILELRHRFLREVARVDLDHCLSKGTLRPCGKNEKCGDRCTFIPYCPSQYLYSHTLLDNILFGALKTADKIDSRLIQLASKAFEKEDLLDDILDIGLNFHVGSKGDRLSGGQQQKLAIARAFMRDTPILIMDEATASLDNASQARIQELVSTRFRDRRKTVIAVMHRLDLAPSYDRIVVLKAGSIIEQGKYDELMARKGAFYELTRGN